MMLGSKQARVLNCVVVRLHAQGESNRVVEVISAEHGRVGLLARGGRASRKRFGGALDRFVSLRVQALPRRGSGLWMLQSADIVDLRLGLRSQLDTIERASRLSECVRELVPEHHSSPEIYGLFVATLDRIASGDLIGAAEAFPRLLGAAGIMPQIQRCGRCGCSDAPLGSLWGACGQPLCVRCAPAAQVLSAAVLAAMGGAPIDDAGVANVVESEVMHVVEAHTGVVLRSRAGLGTTSVCVSSMMS